jgi:outer membrane protein assembly factor BamB
VARGILTAEQQPAVGNALAPRWHFRPDGAMVLAAAAVANGRVFGASAFVDVAGNFGALFCVDAETGAPVWQVEAIGGRDLKAIYSSPVITADGRSLIVGEGLHEDKDCALICLEAATGALRWRVPTPLHIESSPAVLGDLVVAGVGAIEPAGHAPTTGEGFVLGVRISDGKELWRFPLVDVESSPAIAADGTVYVGSGIGGNAVVALRSEPDAALGGEARLMWKASAPYPVTGPITIDGDTIYAGSGRGDMVRGSSEPAGAVLALDRQTGATRWQTEFPDAVLGGVVAGAGKVICPVRNGELVALDVRDGSVLWRQRISGSASLLASPCLVGDQIYAVSSDGVLAVLALHDGAVVEKHLLNASGDPGRSRLSLSSPVVADGRVFVGSETGGLRCFGSVTK